MSDSQAPTRQLTQPVQFLKGVGPQKAKLLEKLGLRTAADILFFFPRSYQDFTQLSDVTQLEADQLVSVVGTVCDMDHQKAFNGRHVLYILLQQGQQFVRAVWFNQPYMVGKFSVGQRVMFQGKAKEQGGRFQMTHPRTTWLDEDFQPTAEGNLLPVYRLTDGINQRQMRDIVSNVVEQFSDLVQEAIPTTMQESANVCSIQAAIKQIHAPKSQQAADDAKRRLIYQELLILQLAIAVRRHRVQTSATAPSIDMSAKIQARILRRLPFELTPSQSNALSEITHDMERSFPMNRLLHGEVGSGKTAVAVCTMLAAIANGNQAALMAPTEILARQHFRTLEEMLAGSRVNLGLLTGSLTSSQRKKINGELQSGAIDIVIGTQAIVGKATRFHNLGLVVIDEQHKFGVHQRAQLKQSKHEPHYLVMTATPIPRTVAMTLFGDLDVSILDKPFGVGNVVNTYLGTEASREQWWEFFRKKLHSGRQGYVVAPLVNADDDSELGSAEQVFESLSNGPLEAFRLDVLHGRQTADEKETAMKKFNAGETQVLVATGVIEVGINVPNATIMTIESAERFGLSQLHQLRGRVSRGKQAGFVCAFATSDDPESNERLKAFEETNNGFELSEIDLRLRGPGNLFSSEQSGFPPLMIADLIRDEEVLKEAQQDARALIASDPLLEGEGMERLHQLVFARYGKALDISDVG